MPDHSHLDQMYFIDRDIYNCPFCNRRHVSYTVGDFSQFDWSDTKNCLAVFVQCDSCRNISMHLSFSLDILSKDVYGKYQPRFSEQPDLDSKIFYSVPTSFFVIDGRIPTTIRELISEADGCLKMNYLTGASACARKAIYELTVKEKAEGPDYETKIKSLKGKNPTVDAELFDILSHIQGMTSDKIHEQSWDKWNPTNLKLILETLKAVLHEIYVVPAEKAARAKAVRDLKAEAGAKESKSQSTPKQSPS